MRNWLKAMREKKGLTKKQVATKLSISQPYYYDVEIGSSQTDMAYSMMERLAAAFDVPVQEIIDAEREYMAEKTNTA